MNKTVQHQNQEIFRWCDIVLRIFLQMILQVLHLVYLVIEQHVQQYQNLQRNLKPYHFLEEIDQYNHRLQKYFLGLKMFDLLWFFLHQEYFLQIHDHMIVDCNPYESMQQWVNRRIFDKFSRRCFFSNAAGYGCNVLSWFLFRLY